MASNTDGTSESAGEAREAMLEDAKTIIADAGDTIEDSYDAAFQAKEDQIATIDKYLKQLDMDDYDEW